MGVIGSIHNGDSGNTSLVGGEIVKKNSSVIRILGEIDELMAFLGLVFCNERLDENKKMAIREIQADLFDVSSFLAGSGVLKISNSDVETVEAWTKGLAGERDLSFVVPGEKGETSAQFHVLRTLARKCERTLYDFLDDGRLSDKLSETSVVSAYLNRLSSLFYAMAEC